MLTARLAGNRLGTSRSVRRAHGHRRPELRGPAGVVTNLLRPNGRRQEHDDANHPSGLPRRRRTRHRSSGCPTRTCRSRPGRSAPCWGRRASTHCGAAGTTFGSCEGRADPSAPRRRGARAGRADGLRPGGRRASTRSACGSGSAWPAPCSAILAVRVLVHARGRGGGSARAQMDTSSNRTRAAHPAARRPAVASGAIRIAALAVRHR